MVADEAKELVLSVMLSGPNPVVALALVDSLSRMAIRQSS